MAPDTPTTCSLLTPHGRGAVAVIGLSGSRAEQTLDSHFEPVGGKQYSSYQRKIVYGVWKSTGEDLIVYRRSGTQTGAQLGFEVHCHGGSMASAAILGDLESAGIESITPQQFIESTCSDSPNNPWKSGVLFTLTKATTNRTAEILLRQVTILPMALDSITSEIRSLNFESALAQIDSILRWSDFGTKLTQPPTVVFCGQPNVGKSSLVNAIVGFQRAIVNEVAGTTRDVVSQSTAIAGWPIELRDTAGLRESKNVIETIGIEKAHAEIESAHLRICVFDIAKQWDQSDQELLDSIEPSLVVLNKSDLVDPSEIQKRLGEVTNSIATSVESGNGIESLIEQVGIRLAPELPDPSQAIPVSAEQVAKLTASSVILKDGLGQTNLTESERGLVVSKALEQLE